MSVPSSRLRGSADPLNREERKPRSNAVTAGGRLPQAGARHHVTPTISSLIASTEAGDRPAADALFSALYAELRHSPGVSSRARGA